MTDRLTDDQVAALRVDPYAPTPNWTPPPRDDAPTPNQRWTPPIACDPRNPYWSAECHALRLEQPRAMPQADDELAASLRAAMERDAAPVTAPSVPEPAPLLLLLASATVLLWMTSQRWRPRG